MKRLLLGAAFLVVAPLALAQSDGTNGIRADKQAQGEVHKGTGVVRKVDRASGKVTLKHDAIQSLNMPAMTMAFGVNDKDMLNRCVKDTKVEFEFVRHGRQYVITSIK